MSKDKIFDRKFEDDDIETILTHPRGVELVLVGGTEALIISKQDVIALAQYFGLVVGRPLPEPPNE